MYHKGARTTTSSSSVTARSVAFYHRLGSSPPAGNVAPPVDQPGPRG